MARKTIKQMTREMLAAATRKPRSEQDTINATEYVVNNIGRCYYRFRIEGDYQLFKSGRGAYDIMECYYRELWNAWNEVKTLLAANIDYLINY